MRGNSNAKDQGDSLLRPIRDVNRIIREEEKNESMMNNHVVYQVSQHTVAVINCSSSMGWQCNEKTAVNMH